jgi:hypothetical protein
MRFPASYSLSREIFNSIRNQLTPGNTRNSFAENRAYEVDIATGKGFWLEDEIAEHSYYGLFEE